MSFATFCTDETVDRMVIFVVLVCFLWQSSAAEGSLCENGVPLPLRNCTMKTMDDTKILAGNIYENASQINTPVECRDTCLETPWCASATFNKRTGVCSIHPREALKAGTSEENCCIAFEKECPTMSRDEEPEEQIICPLDRASVEPSRKYIYRKMNYQLNTHEAMYSCRTDPLCAGLSYYVSKYGWFYIYFYFNTDAEEGTPPSDTGFHAFVKNCTGTESSCRLWKQLDNQQVKNVQHYRSTSDVRISHDCLDACERDTQCDGASFTITFTYSVSFLCKMYRMPRGGFQWEENTEMGRATTWIRDPELCDEDRADDNLLLSGPVCESEGESEIPVVPEDGGIPDLPAAISNCTMKTRDDVRILAINIFEDASQINTLEDCRDRCMVTPWCASATFNNRTEECSIHPRSMFKSEEMLQEDCCIAFEKECPMLSEAEEPEEPTLCPLDQGEAEPPRKFIYREMKYQRSTDEAIYACRRDPVCAALSYSVSKQNWLSIYLYYTTEEKGASPSNTTLVKNCAGMTGNVTSCRLMKQLDDQQIIDVQEYRSTSYLRRSYDCLRACEKDIKCDGVTFIDSPYLCKMYNMPRRGFQLEKYTETGRATTWIKDVDLCGVNITKIVVDPNVPLAIRKCTMKTRDDTRIMAGNMYEGASEIKTPQECRDQCIVNPWCSGATFFNTTGQCRIHPRRAFAWGSMLKENCCIAFEKECPMMTRWGVPRAQQNIFCPFDPISVAPSRKFIYRQMNHKQNLVEAKYSCRKDPLCAAISYSLNKYKRFDVVFYYNTTAEEGTLPSNTTTALVKNCSRSGSPCRLWRELYDYELYSHYYRRVTDSIRRSYDCLNACESDPRCDGATYTNWVRSYSCKFYRYMPRSGYSWRKHTEIETPITWVKAPRLCTGR